MKPLTAVAFMVLLITLGVALLDRKLSIDARNDEIAGLRKALNEWQMIAGRFELANKSLLKTNQQLTQTVEQSIDTSNRANRQTRECIAILKGER